MPRGPRRIVGGVIYHVLNRGNDRKRIFHKPGDYNAFVQLLREGKAQAHIDLLGYCLMPNHWHVALLPYGDEDVAKFIGWVTNTHVRRYCQHYQTVGEGHVYQGRYKSFAVQDDHHFLVMMLCGSQHSARRLGAAGGAMALVQRMRGWISIRTNKPLADRAATQLD
jgi:putative transposase